MAEAEAKPVEVAQRRRNPGKSRSRWVWVLWFVPAIELAACRSHAAGPSPQSPAPAEQRASVASLAPPPSSDWSTEYRGSGDLSVTVSNASDVAVFVRVRDNRTLTTAAQVLAGARAETTVYLGGGEFDVLMRAPLYGQYRYFKAAPISVPPGVVGRAVLSVGIASNGEALHEIDAKEFER